MKKTAALITIGLITVIAGCQSSAELREQEQHIIACPEDARICEDGSIVTRQGKECTFAACPVDLETSILPEGELATEEELGEAVEEAATEAEAS